MKSPFIRAHGYVPGPTQRPLIAGVVTGVIATIPAVVTAEIGGALQAAARGLDASAMAVLVLFGLVLAAAGAVYGWLFMRAANDRRGGWLFGLTYGFLVWMLGPAALLPMIAGLTVVVGVPAQFMFGSHLVYGLSLGALFPYVSNQVRRRFAS
jgi:hypothetical protein